MENSGLTQSQENALAANQQKMAQKELDAIAQYKELKKHNLPIAPALTRELEDIIAKYK